jgi:SAM-dependent methyltransferase
MVWYELDSFWETMPLFTEERRQMAPGEIDDLLSLISLEPGASVLDLCCGVGRHSLELARRGYHVTGVDRTPSYLQVAREKAEAEGLVLELVRADMRRFERPAAFDAAINLFTSFGYFEDPADDRQVAVNLARSLRPDGLLVMDTMGKEILARIYQPRDWQELPDGRLFLQERQVTRDWTWIENRWVLITADERHEFVISHRLYDGAGLRTLLLSSGFASVDLYGSLQGSPYDTQARRLVAVARKGVSQGRSD